MTLLRELIEIPEEVHGGDFVINLSQAAGDTERTLKDYVVTDQLADAYDNALGFIASAVRERQSKAAYLDGSFGSGKSHFMAVLHLLLQRDPHVRALPELAEVIARHDRALEARTFELLPVHMLGAETLEQRVFESYLQHLRRVDPDAPPPAVFLDEPLFRQAEQLRAEQGDQRFFATLNRGQAAEEGWGELAAAWTPDTYEAARSARPGDPARARLVGELIATHLPMFTEVFRGATGGFVEIDAGLAELARHAHARGNDALVLFLDEVILWLGSRMADTAFVEREGQKLVKLVEYSHEREIPLISFLARQRDLREFIGEELPGSERLSFIDALRHSEGRFHRISLADRNLPKIAQRRLLKPVSEQARAQLDEAFAELERSRPDVLQALMTDDSDRETFRISYPFSPAFVKTLIAASSALQRERTALRLMLQLLVDRREELELGDLVAAGELFGLLSTGDEPFSEELRLQFQLARDLYEQTLRPLLLAQHGLDEEQAGTLEPTHQFRGDDRLVKTLLLAALFSKAEPLRNLDVARLTALNHGSIATPIPGGERTIVLDRLQKLAAAGAPLRLGEDRQNPSVELRLTGVDVETVIDKAKAVDNPGARRATVKRLLAEELGLDTERLTSEQQRVLWRGTWREVDVLFGNLRDESAVPGDALKSSGERWKLVIDYPFDERLHSPAEDLERLERWRAETRETRTVCWLPAFLSSAMQRQLGRLVVIEHVLAGDRLEQYADHLSRQDRELARAQLSDQLPVLRGQLLAALRQAYGLERDEQGTVEQGHDPALRLQSLMDGYTPQLPVGETLGKAFASLVRSMLDFQYPDHPHFDEEVRTRDLRIVWEEVQHALEGGGRIDSVASDRRRVLRRITMPLELGSMGEAPFVLSATWRERLDQAIARARTQGQLPDPVTVGQLRRLLDQPRPRGLTREVSALIILTYARQTGRTFSLQQGPTGDVGVDRLPDELELVAARLPEERQWERALGLAPALFGLGSLNPALTPVSVDALAAAVREHAAALAPDAAALERALGKRLDQLGIDPADAERARSAAAAHELAELLADAGDPLQLVERLAAAELPSSAQAIGVSLRTAGTLTRALEDERWRLIERLAEGAAGSAGEQALDGLHEALQRDEFSQPLSDAVAAAYDAGVELLTARAPEPEPPPAPGRTGSPPPSPPGEPSPPAADSRHGHLTGLTPGQARAKLDELEAAADGRLSVELVWTINEP